MPNTTDHSRRILEMLAQGKITVDEADQLLRAIGDTPADAPPKTSADTAGPSAPRWLRVTVDKAATAARPAKQVSIRVPMALLRGGVRLGAMFPGLRDDPVARHLRENGIDFAKLDGSEIDRVLANLGETVIDVDDGKAQVRVTCE
jgi:hypothetical protein